MGVKSPPWVGNPFPTLLATLNITCGREILLTVFLHYPQTWWERDFQPEIRVKKGGEGISHPRGDFADFPLMGCVKKGGEGIPHPRGKKGGKGISHPRQEGWERDFPPTGRRVT